jgi:hypothetical protein
MNEDFSLIDKQIVLIKSLSWIFLASLIFTATLLGLFHTWIILGVFILGIFLLVNFSLRKKLFFSFSKELLLVSLLILCFVTFLSFFVTPTIFSGRDQGTLSEAAARLAQNHKLTFTNPASQEFFTVYGQGKALNFPGFYYTENGSLTPQFPLVYISWLAFFYSFFGVTGFIIANALLLYFFIFSFYALSRKFLNKNYTLLSLAFIFTSFSFAWFFKFTLSENMALALAWTMIFALVEFLKRQEKLSYSLFLLSAVLLTFTRIEGIALLGISLFLIFKNQEARNYLKKRLLFFVIFPIIIFLFAFALNFFWDLNFYREIGKAILGTITKKENGLDIIEKTSVLPSFYLLKIFTLYGILGFLLFGAIGVIRSFFRKNYFVLTIFFVIFPTLIYLIDANISMDQPWMLRRYVFSILPAAIFYTTFLLYEWRMEMLKNGRGFLKTFPPIIIAAVLILLNLPSFSRFVLYSENKSLFAQTEKLSNNFTNEDLVLLDKNTAGDGWAMLSGPMSFLFGKNTAYFFNINDLKKIDYTKFKNVYLIVPNDESAVDIGEITNRKLIFYKNYAISINKLDTLNKENYALLTYPEKIQKEITGTIYIIRN